MIIDLGTVKLRFDSNEVRINIDGDKIDIGVREQVKRPELLPQINEDGWVGPGLFTLTGTDVEPKGRLLFNKDITQDLYPKAYLELSEEIRKNSQTDLDTAKKKLNEKINENRKLMNDYVNAVGRNMVERAEENNAKKKKKQEQ